MPLIAILAQLGVSFFGDLARSLQTIGDPRGAEGMNEVLDAYAMAQVVALAILADGEISATEREVLERVATEKLDDATEAGRMLAQLQFQSLPTGDPAEVTEAIRLVARRLSPTQRRQTHEVVAELARGGSGLPGRSGYRVHRASDSEGLLEAVAEGLGIAPRG